MPRQFQDSQDSHDPEDLHYPPNVLELFRGALIGLRETEGNEIGHDGQKVNNVERAFEKLPLVGGGPEAGEVL